MNAKPQANQRPQGGLNLSDIYFVLFRHKWMILVFSSLGLIAAAAFYALRPAVYTSEATVMIKRIFENTGASPSTLEGQTHEVTEGPDSLIFSEMAIISSFDLAVKVATNVGPASILAKYGGGDNANAAAAILHKSLIVDRIPKSPVLKITLTHRDEKLVQPLLQAVVSAYQEIHHNIYVKGSTY